MHKLLVDIKVEEHVIQPYEITNLNNNKKVPIKNARNNKIAMS